ncbi:MAG: hypothetical protein GXP45_03725 [bacterium]|nr:hypothetical protein [bacterium]
MKKNLKKQKNFSLLDVFSQDEIGDSQGVVGVLSLVLQVRSGILETENLIHDFLSNRSVDLRNEESQTIDLVKSIFDAPFSIMVDVNSLHLYLFDHYFDVFFKKSKYLKFLRHGRQLKQKYRKVDKLKNNIKNVSERRMESLSLTSLDYLKTRKVLEEFFYDILLREIKKLNIPLEILEKKISEIEEDPTVVGLFLREFSVFL